MVRDKGFSHHDSKEALQHRGQVECAAGGRVRRFWCESPRGCYSQRAGGWILPPAISPSEHILSEGGRATCSLSG